MPTDDDAPVGAREATARLRAALRDLMSVV
jgi:hypothetical protein